MTKISETVALNILKRHTWETPELFDDCTTIYAKDKSGWLVTMTIFGLQFEKDGVTIAEYLPPKVDTPFLWFFKRKVIDQNDQAIRLFTKLYENAEAHNAQIAETAIAAVLNNYS